MGYNIPISVSNAESFAVPQSTNAATYFLFASPNSKITDAPKTEQDPQLPSTATSSAALGNASASSNGSGVSAPSAAAAGLFGIAGLNVNTLLLAGIAALLYFKKRG